MSPLFFFAAESVDTELTVGERSATDRLLGTVRLTVIICLVTPEGQGVDVHGLDVMAGVPTASARHWPRASSHLISAQSLSTLAPEEASMAPRYIKAEATGVWPWFTGTPPLSAVQHQAGAFLGGR